LANAWTQDPVSFTYTGEFPPAPRLDKNRLMFLIVVVVLGIAAIFGLFLGLGMYVSGYKSTKVIFDYSEEHETAPLVVNAEQN